MQPVLFSLLLLLHTLALVSACHALLHKRDSRSALGWIAILLVMPPVGLPLYWLFGIARVDSRAVQLMNKAALRILHGHVDLHGKSLQEKPLGFIAEENLPPPYSALSLAGHHITGRCLTKGNRICSLHNGEEAYPAMLEAISEARERVYLSTFIFSHDPVGKAFAAALAAASRRGCDVRVLMDGVGSWNPLAHWQKHLGKRVRLAYFLPPRLMPPQFSINLRTHRKVLICDGTVAFTGGMNISQHHLVRLPRPQRVQDLHFRCRGAIVQELEMGFLMDWSFSTGETLPMLNTLPDTRGNALCRIVMDGPGSPEDTILDLLCAQISSARRSVKIMSPYFLPPHQLASALTSAALRGVAVQVILPQENNHRIVDWAMRHQNLFLLDKHCRIAYQPPPFAHTKLLLIDDIYVLIGSANLDPRSLSLNFELVMEILDEDLYRELDTFYETVLARSTPATTSLPPLTYQLRNAFCWMFSPYL